MPQNKAPENISTAETKINVGTYSDLDAKKASSETFDMF